MIEDYPSANIIGHIVSSRVEGNSAVVEVEISDSVGANAIQSGVRELSVGYRCTLDAARYQRNLKIDHVALVPLGRCGPQCRLDCQGAHSDAHPSTPCGCQALRTSATARAPCTCTTRAVDFQGTQMATTDARTDKKLTAAERHHLPSHLFADPKHEGLPIEDETHVRGAMARFNQEHFTGPSARKSAFHRIVARAHELGMDPSGFVKKFGGRLDDDDGDSEGVSMDKRADDATDGDAPSGGGAAGRAQEPFLVAGISDSSFDMGAKFKSLQDEIGAQTARALKAETALGDVMTRVAAAEKARDEAGVRADKAEKDCMDHKDRADKAEKERDGYRAQLDAMRDERDSAIKGKAESDKRADKSDAVAKSATEKARLDALGERNSLINAEASRKAEIVTKASFVLGFDKKHFATSDRDLMAAVVKKVHDVELAAGETIDYVRARFDAAIDRALDVAGSQAQMRQAVGTLRMDAVKAAVAKPLVGSEAERNARDEMIHKTESALQSVTKKD